MSTQLRLPQGSEWQAGYDEGFFAGVCFAIGRVWCLGDTYSEMHLKIMQMHGWIDAQSDEPAPRPATPTVSSP